MKSIDLSVKMNSIYGTCLKEAEKSQVAYKLGCIATHGGKIIGRGYNTTKFSKENCTCHAEMNVLQNLYDAYSRKSQQRKILHIFRKTKLYIGRLTPGGNSQNSAPCYQCIDKIRAFNIKKIIFCLDQKYYIVSPKDFTHYHITDGQSYIKRISL